MYLIKYRSFLIVLSLLALVLCGWGFSRQQHPDDHGAQILRLALRTEPLTTDPKRNSDGITSLFFLFIAEGLTRITQDGTPAPALAEKILVSEDQLTYTFILREAYWSDGTPITAADFKTSWLQALDPHSAAYNPEYLFVIQHAKEAYEQKRPLEEVLLFTPDDSTLQVTLEYPTPYFLELVATKIFFPAPQKTLSEVYSGPFVIKEWLCQDKILLEKNPWYWDKDSVRLEQIELHILDDETTQLSLFEKQQLDWVGAPFSLLPIDSLSALKNHTCFHAFSTASIYFYSFNTQRFPLNHLKVREALTYAIHRQELIEHVSQGGEEPALALLPPKMHGIHHTYFKDGDLQRAQKLFQEALDELHLTVDTFPPLVLSYPAIQARHVMAQAIQQQWQSALGVTVTLESKEWQVFLSDINQRNYEIGALGRGTHHLDPIYFLSLFKTAQQATNRTGWENVDYLKTLETSYHTIDPEQRDSLLHHAEEIFMAHMPVAPILFPTNYYLKNPRLRGVFLSDVGVVDFKWAYFDE